MCIPRLPDILNRRGRALRDTAPAKATPGATAIVAICKMLFSSWLHCSIGASYGDSCAKRA